MGRPKAPGSAHDRILDYLSRHPRADRLTICSALDLGRGTVSSAIHFLQTHGHVQTEKGRGRAVFYSLATNNAVYPEWLLKAPIREWF